jgi:hypothetical protein
MCYAFQSPPQATIKEYFDDDETSTLGLNVLPPLFDGIPLSVEERVIYTTRCSDSKDSHINTFPAARKQQKKLDYDSKRQGLATFKRKSTYQIWSAEDYHLKLLSALNSLDPREHIPWLVDLESDIKTSVSLDVERLLQDVSMALDPSSDTSPVIAPYGQPTARIGVILECQLIHKSPNIANIERSICAVPDLFIKSQFTAEKAMIWTADLMQCFSPRFISTRHPWPEDQCTILSKFHRDLIQGSNLRVILLCGENAEKVCLTEEIRRNQIKISLQQNQLQCFFETMMENQCKTIRRIYLCVDSFHDKWHHGDWDKTRSCSELISFMAKITGTKNIKQNAGICHHGSQLIILRYHQEKIGTLEPMTLATLDSRIKDWLAVKGILSDEQIAKWEELAGSLSKGLFLLLCTVPRRSRQEERGIPPLLKRSDCRLSVFSKEMIAESKRLYARFTKGKGMSNKTPLQGPLNRARLTNNDIADHDLVPLHQLLEDISADSDKDDRGQDEEMTTEELLGTIHSIRADPHLDLDENFMSLPERRTTKVMKRPRNPGKDYDIIRKEFLSQGHWYAGSRGKGGYITGIFSPTIRFQFRRENG